MLPINELEVQKMRRAKRRRTEAAVPLFDDPFSELRRLVQVHKALTKRAVMLSNTIKDRVVNGVEIKCRLPDLDKAMYADLSKASKAHADDLLPAIATQLALTPCHAFVDAVYGLGPIVGAYLAVYVDIRKSEKPSQLIRYCGYAVIDGHADRGSRGETRHYNADLKTRLYQAMSAMLRNGARATKDAPHGHTNKYLDLWHNAKHAAITVQGMTPGKAHDKGRRKATDALLRDYYTMARTFAGLAVYPGYYEAARDRMHGGSDPAFEPRVITVDEAWALVGDVGKRPLSTPRAWTIDSDVVEAAGSRAMRAVAERYLENYVRREQLVEVLTA